MQTRAGNTTTMLSLIVAILLTLLFGVLAYVKHDEAKLHHTGNPEVDPESVNNSLEARLSEINEIETSLTGLEDTIDRKQETLNDLDIYLASRSAYFDDTTGVWVIGDPDKFKTRRQMMTSEVSYTLALLENRARELNNQDPIFEPLEEVIDDFQNKTNAVLQDITNMDAQLAEDKENLHTKLEDLESKQRADRKAFQKRSSEIKTAISQADDEIRRLLELQLRWLKELKPDGRVLSITEDRSRMIIDIGSQDRVFNGLKLDIFQYVRGGFIRKGQCEVINTEGQIATCRVIEEVDPRRNPIAKDDMIGNPVFDTRRPLTFVLAGEFKEFNRSDLENFIRRTGSRVRPDLGPGIDFLVAGDRSDSAQDKAREYQILAMTEEQLVRYLNTTFKIGE